MTETLRPRLLAALLAAAIAAGVGSAYVVAEVLRLGLAYEPIAACGERPCVHHFAVRVPFARGE